MITRVEAGPNMLAVTDEVPTELQRASVSELEMLERTLISALQMIRKLLNKQPVIVKNDKRAHN